MGASTASRNGVTVVASGGPVFFGTAESRRKSDDSIATTTLAAYLASGEQCFDAMSGRFALAIIDDNESRVVIAVDPMGIERMTYAAAGDTLAFGSSAEAVARFPGRDVRLDHQSLFDFLILHMVPAPGTIFEGVRKLRPGYCATFEKGGVRERRYWNARFADDSHADYDQLKGELHRSLRTAVRDCAPSKSAGAFLSGGLDSSTVAGILSEVGRRPRGLSRSDSDTRSTTNCRTHASPMPASAARATNMSSPATTSPTGSR